MIISTWQPEFTRSIIRSSFLLILAIVSIVLSKYVNVVLGAVLSVSFLGLLFWNLIKFHKSLLDRKNFLNSIVMIVGNFIFYESVRNPLLLIIWLKEYEKGFNDEIKDLMRYLRDREVLISTDYLTGSVFIKFKDVGKVGYIDKEKNRIVCKGFQKNGYIEVEWDSGNPDKTAYLLRHEIAHLFIDLVEPGLSERAHHKIMQDL